MEKRKRSLKEQKLNQNEGWAAGVRGGGLWLAGRCERLAWVASSSVEREGEKLINTCLGVDRREESIKHAPFSKHTGAGPGTDWGGSGVCHVKYVGRRGRSEQCAQKVTQPARHERPCPRGAPRLGGQVQVPGP